MPEQQDQEIKQLTAENLTYSDAYGIVATISLKRNNIPPIRFIVNSLMGTQVLIDGSYYTILNVEALGADNVDDVVKLFVRQPQLVTTKVIYENFN